MYNNSRKPYMKRLAEDTQLYQVIHLDGETLKFEARTATGMLYDAFRLEKVAGERNRLIELDAEVPERLRPALEESVK